MSCYTFRMTIVLYGMKLTIIAGISLLLVVCTLPNISVAATENIFEISGWVPYWRSKTGVENILPQIQLFTEVNPFFYTVTQDGMLYPNGSLTDAEWVMLKNKAKETGVRFIPTVTWANADAMDAIFRDPDRRQEHIRSIAREVYAHNLDGIDIDYEGKYAHTRPYFSLFLEELNEAIGFDRWIMCTIEARTPLDSRYETPEDIPADIEYANDFSEINKHCERVRIMAYDQGRFDVKLNNANKDPYVPVADRAWVEKVMRLTALEIDKSKLVIGVPTYGYEYDMFSALDGSGEMEYSRLWSFNMGYATDTAAKLGLTPVRNSAGELLLTYPASQSPDGVIPVPFATRVATWSDAEAVREKAELAKELGVRGIAIFKIDGGQDPLLRGVLEKFKEVKVSVSEPVVPQGGTPQNITVVTFKRDLEYGTTGEDVKALQVYLNKNGFTVAVSGGGASGNETQWFGPATQNALIRFQKAKNIKPSIGYFGPITRKFVGS